MSADSLLDYVLDGWMTYEFTSFSTVFQSYLHQDDGQVIMKDCVECNPVYD